MPTAPPKKYTPEEDLALEDAAEYRSEYYQGEIFAMAGALDRILRDCLYAAAAWTRGLSGERG